MPLQVMQPPQRHTRKLHTMIVAAYHCIHQWAAGDKVLCATSVACFSAAQNIVAECARDILEAVQLGMMGGSPDASHSDAYTGWVFRKSGATKRETFNGRRCMPAPVEPSHLSESSNAPSIRVQESALVLLRRLFFVQCDPVDPATRKSSIIYRIS